MFVGRRRGAVRRDYLKRLETLAAAGEERFDSSSATASDSQRCRLHAVVTQLGLHTRVASAVRAPHQEIATSATRIQLSRTHRRASDWRRPAGMFPPPS